MKITLDSTGESAVYRWTGESFGSPWMVNVIFRRTERGITLMTAYAGEPVGSGTSDYLAFPTLAEACQFAADHGFTKQTD